MFAIMKNEIWKDVVGYEGLYQVSNNGNVSRNGRILKGGVNKEDKIVLLYKCGVRTSCFVHRLVAEAFIPNPDKHPQINHIDEVKTNNSVNNLEWCTQQYNNSFGTRIKRAASKTAKKVYQYDLDGNLIAEWSSVMECSRNGFSQSSISLCCRNRITSYKKCIWRYE